MGGDGWRGVDVRKTAEKLFRSIRCGCEKQRNYHRTFTSKAVVDVFAVFATGKYSRKCECRARARGMAQSIIRIVIIRCRKIRCRKCFVRLIFVALCDYENFSTAKISRFTVFFFVAHAQAMDTSLLSSFHIAWNAYKLRNGTTHTHTHTHTHTNYSCMTSSGQHEGCKR